MFNHTKCVNVLYLHLSFFDDSRMEEAQIIFIKQKYKKARQKNLAQMMFLHLKQFFSFWRVAQPSSPRLTSDTCGERSTVK